MEDFYNDSFKNFIWRWNGYYRRVERANGQSMRELAAILINVNRGKNSRVVKSHKIYPLSIDDINNEIIQGFDADAAQKLLDAAKAKGWLN